MTSRFTTLVGIITSATLLFQIIILVRNQCYTATRSMALATALRKERLYNYQMDNTSHSPEINSKTSLVQTKALQKRWLTIGIPTIERRDGSYFPSMIESLLNQTTDDHLDSIYIVIFLADLNKTEWKDSMEKELRRKYSKFFESGTLKVIRAPQSFYAGLNTSSTVNKYWYWRTKQNYDYAYIMQYCHHMSDYYMQMEDDVITAEGYLKSISEYMKKQTDDNWICLEFSELGFIGKLYHERDVGALVQMFMIFSETQPVDFTYLYFNMLKGQGQRLIRKPTLFQHIGYHSSLSDKVQALKDHFFDLPSKKYRSDNPAAELYTTLDVYSDFPPELAYHNVSGYFWSSSSPKEGDIFVIMFLTPQSLDRVTVETGTKDHQTDIINAGVVEASTTLVDSKQPPFCKDYVVLGQFINGVANISDIHSMMGVFTTKCLQIRVTRDQTPWVIIREIALWVQK